MPNVNPYESPKGPGALHASALPTELNIARSSKRLTHLILDSFFCWIVSFLLGFTLAILLPGQDAQHALRGVFGQLSGLGVWIIYYVSQELLLGRTLAKFITGTKVVSDDGSMPTLAQIVGRTFCRLIPFEAFSFMLGEEPPVGWHDKFSRTRVITVGQPTT